jgi:fumarate reductase flavoprotein subunit
MTAPEKPVVVLGAGLAGHCAALAAAQAGASVLLLEKAERPGGSTLQSSGTFAFCGTDLQRRAGIVDSPDQLRTDLHKASGGHADPALIELYVTHQAETYDWLKRQGVQFDELALSSNMSVPRSHPTRPAQLMAALQARVRSNPRVSYRNRVHALRVERNAQGVRALKLADGCTVEARAIVLATGGFSRNPGLIARFAPKLSDATAVGGDANTGDGLRMAWALGADLLDMAWINGTFGVSVNDFFDRDRAPGDQPVLRLALYRGAIAVNVRGERFIDESVSYKVIGERCLEQPRRIAFQVFDRKIMAQSVSAPNSNDYRSALEAGLVRQADSIASLADAAGIDPTALERTVRRYNEDALAGCDSVFGRQSLGTGWGALVPLDTVPFYIYPCTTAILGTYCGVRVDQDMRVIDVLGSPIDGLYAAGEIVGGFHGAGYMSGSALGKAAIFGLRAGERAARHAGLALDVIDGRRA